MAEFMGYKNKGLYYRDKARKKHRRLLHVTKGKQVGACFFAKVKNPKTARLYNENTFLGYEKLLGLVIENKTHFIDETGKLRFVYVNKRGFKILEVYNDIPEWADERLVSMYKEFKETIES